MKSTNQRGFTLVELMIAVAILGILAGLMVVAFDGKGRKVKTGSEALAMFAEMHRAQSQYAVENGVYASTGDDESDIHPITPGRQSQDVGTLPAEWSTLRITPTNPKLMCGYVTVAGAAGDAIPAFATGFGMVQPETNWYVLFARCNADGNDAVDANYFASSVDMNMQKLNDGR